LYKWEQKMIAYNVTKYALGLNESGIVHWIMLNEIVKYNPSSTIILPSFN